MTPDPFLLLAEIIAEELPDPRNLEEQAADYWREQMETAASEAAEAAASRSYSK